MSFVQQVYGASPRALQRSRDDYPETSETLFAPYLWTTNGPRGTSFATISYNNTVEVPFSMFSRGDLIGLIWESQDNYSHAGRAYNNYTNYSGVTWVFDVELSANMPIISEPTQAFTLTIENTQGVCYVPLAQYANTPDSRTARITLDFDDMTGNIFQGANGVKIEPNGITKLFIALINSSYIKDDVTVLSAREDSIFKLTSVSVVNPRPFTRKNLTVPTQEVGLATSYDDMHNQSPERVIRQMKALGFAGKVNHYCGMSRYPNRQINASLGRQLIVETLGNTVIESAKRWHEVFAELLNDEGWDAVFAVSFEMFSIFANTNYAQRDDDGNLGFTGYSPPSYLLSPVIDADEVPAIAGHTQVGSMTYLGNVFADFAETMKTGGLTVDMQIGEPWWWWNPNGAPCYYGAVARQKYFDETGDFAPRIMSVNDLTGIDITDNGPYTGLQSSQQNFIKWCRDKLGAATHYLRDRIQATDTDAKATLLFFLPTILNEDVGMVNIVNYPKSYYTRPAFDYFMTEAYDWVIKGTGSKADRAITLSTVELGYAHNETETLVGFVPDQVLASAFNWQLLDDVQYKRELWGRLFGTVEKNKRVNNGLGIGRQYLWSYPQVMRDNIVLRDGETAEGLNRNDLRRIESDYEPTFIDFAPLIDPDAPSAPSPFPPPPPEQPTFNATFKQHVLGDSFVTTNFVNSLRFSFGAIEGFVTSDGVGATTLTQQAVRYANTPDYHSYNLIIMDGGLDTVGQVSIDAIESMTRNLTHSRWVYVEPSPSNFKLGTTERAYHDSLVQAIRNYVGNDRFVECLTALQAANDGSTEDLQDVADGLVPRSLRSDFIHENAAGEAIRTKVIADFLNAKGWHYQPNVSWDCHYIGDSGIDSTYSPVEDTVDFAYATFGNRYSSITMDGVGGTSYAQQAVRFASTPEHYDKTLIIWESGSDDFASGAIDAIDDMVGRLSHNRWAIIQWTPKYNLGTTQRAFEDGQNELIRQHVGANHYIPMLDIIQSKHDGSAEDLEDIENGLIPRSLRLDNFHYNPRGHFIAFNIVADRIRELGY